MIRNTDVPRYVRNGTHCIRRGDGEVTAAEASYQTRARESGFSALQRLGQGLQHQIHHFLPIYLGGGHQSGNLVQAEGHAARTEVPVPSTEDPNKTERIALTAHAKLHEVIDATDITEFVRPAEQLLEAGQVAPPVTLDWHSLATAFPLEDLNVSIGELHGDGCITYEVTERPIKDGLIS